MGSKTVHRMLLRGGTLIIHNEDDRVSWETADLLIEDDRIAEIGNALDVDPETTVIDCTGKIVSPGFIDTHHHLWQTALKGIHADHNLLDYFHTGNFANSLYEPDDVFWGQLSGALECIDAGTTTVVDHAHINYSPAHSKQAIKATTASGIRAIFGYCPTPRVAQWKPAFKLEADLLPDWVMETFHTLAKKAPFGAGGQVELGFAFDGLWLPKEVLQKLFAEVRAAGVALITTHSLHCAMSPGPSSSAGILDNYGLLASDILLSHHNNPMAEDTSTIKRSRAHIASTPSSEIQMSQGNPVCLDRDLFKQSSLGIDIHTLCSASIPTQMMLALQYERGRRNEQFEKAGKWPSKLSPRCEDVYNLGTILGARAVGRENDLGSLEVGKKADIVIFDGTTPGMLVAAEHNPVAAIVLNSSIRDIDTVIVDGVPRKQGGRLLDAEITLDDDLQGDTPSHIAWAEVAKQVLASLKRVDERKKVSCDPKIAANGVIDAFYLNRDGIAERI